jgi:hypothetical protein
VQLQASIILTIAAVTALALSKKKNGRRISLLELELVLAVVGAIAARAAIDLHEKLAAAPSTCAAALPPLHC